MSRFPSSLPLPESVAAQRKERCVRMIKTARRGVILRGSIILAELAGFVAFNSSALLLDALSSLFDVAASVFLIFCIKLANRPPDRHHPFGHGRFEPIAGLQLGLVLAVIGGALLFQQISVLATVKQEKTIDAFSWLIPLAAIVLLEISHQHLKKTAKRQNSPALLADAVHYRIDALNSLFAMVALIFAALFPKYGALCDHLGALVIALLMVGLGIFAARKNIDQLLDRVPPEHYFQLVKEAALKVQGVFATEKLRIQTYGPDAHVSIDIEVDPTQSVETAHELTQHVRAEIQRVWPAVRDVIVHVEPYYPGDH